MTDVGEVTDPGIDQDSWAGALDAAKRIGATDPLALHSTTTDMIFSNVQSLIGQGMNVIVTVGYAADEYTVNFAKSNPDIHFIGVDQGGSSVPNLQGLFWKRQDAGYLAGIVAASISKHAHILTVGRADSYWLTSYMIGYLNGAKSVNPDIKVDLAYISTAADEWEDSYDSAAGKAFTKNLLDASPDIDVVFQVGGGEYDAGGFEATTLGSTGAGILEAACDKGVYAIGMGVDQHLSLADDASATKCLVTSAQIFFSRIVSDAIVRISDGTSTSLPKRLGVSTGSVGLAPFYDFRSLVTSDVQARIDAAIAGLTSGSLSACVEDAGEVCAKPGATR